MAIAFGGSHYSKKFTDKMIDQDYYIGHICPKYSIKYLNDNLIKEMIDKTYPKPKIALFDKKGMKRKGEIKFILENYDIEVIQI